MDSQSHTEDAELIIHYWTHQDVDHINSQDVLTLGQQLVDAASETRRWCQPRASSEPFTFDFHGVCWTYSKVAPRSESSGIDWTRSIYTLKEWNAEVDDNDADEVFTIEDLEEFASTNIDDVSSRVHTHLPRPMSIAACQDGTVATPLAIPRKTRARDSEATSDGEPEAKRPRLDTDSLYKVVPQPHYHPCPSPPSSALPEVDFGGLYAPLKSKPIHPHTFETVKIFLDRFWGRGAWVIPVRGALPWEGCTPASMLSENAEPVQGEDLLPSGPSRKSKGPSSVIKVDLTWTHDALVDFWQFLLSLQAARTLGPLSLSFHTAPVVRTSSNVTPQPGHAVSNSPSNTGEITAATVDARVALLAMDHIKVYHDVRYSMQLRNVLSAWWYKYPKDTAHPDEAAGTNDDHAAVAPGETLGNDAGLHSEQAPGEDVDGTRAKERPPKSRASRIRLFKGSKLALVDERSKGVLTS